MAQAKRAACSAVSEVREVNETIATSRTLLVDSSICLQNYDTHKHGKEQFKTYLPA